MHAHIYICVFNVLMRICMYISICILDKCMYIYIYRKRERERENVSGSPSPTGSPVLLRRRSVARIAADNQSTTDSQVVYQTRRSSSAEHIPNVVGQMAILQTAREQTEEYLLLHASSPDLDFSTRSQPASPPANLTVPGAAIDADKGHDVSDPNICTMKLVRVPVRVPDPLLTQDSLCHSNVCDRSILCLSGPDDSHQKSKDTNNNRTYCEVCIEAAITGECGL